MKELIEIAYKKSRATKKMDIRRYEQKVTDLEKWLPRFSKKMTDKEKIEWRTEASALHQDLFFTHYRDETPDDPAKKAADLKKRALAAMKEAMSIIKKNRLNDLYID